MTELRQPPKPPIDTSTVKKVFWVNPHRTADSFMLMLYASQDRSVTEYLWNNREGVTPFGIRSRDGKTELFHAAWEYDIYCPTYRPEKGMRIFVSLTQEKAREYAEQNVEAWWDGDMSAVPPLPGMKDRWESKEAAIADLAETYYSEHGPGETPDIIEVDDAWLAALPENDGSNSNSG